MVLLRRTSTTMSELVTTTNNPAALSDEDIALLKESSGHAAEFKKEEKLTPWLIVIQSMSPYAKHDDPQRIEGAREGHITDTLSLKLRERAAFIPVKFE